MPPRLPLLFQISRLSSIPHLTYSAPPPRLSSRAEGSDVSLYKSPTPPPPLHHHQQHRYNHHNHNPNLLNLNSHKLHQQNLITPTSHTVNTPFSSFITSLSFTRSSSSASTATAPAPTSTITSTPITTASATTTTATATTTTTMSAAKVQKLIDENPVVVFSKSYCPYCKAAKALLTENGAKFEVIELDQTDGGADMQDALKILTGQTTVPNIFIGQQHIGGNSDLQAKKGELPQLLAAAGAV